MSRSPRSLLLLLAAILAPLAATGQETSDAESAAREPAADSVELVVLVHGMGRTSMSMLPLEISLERSGYRVLNFQYSSYGPSVAQIGAGLARSIDAELKERPARRVHFVGHSLGNIVLRWVLAYQRPDADLGRFVMLAPPNRGSRVADQLAPHLGWLLAPIGELRTRGGTAVSLPSPSGVEFAIIIGRWDEKVTVEESCLPGASAHRIVPGGHTFIAMRPDVTRMIRQFLADGTLPDTDPPPVSPCR